MLLAAKSFVLWSASFISLQFLLNHGNVNGTIKPKVFIIDMYDMEGSVWQHTTEFNVLARNITVPGFSPLFPQAHCTADGDICQLVTGEAEINAASTITALVHSPTFDLTQTYFLIAGVAGINPKVTTIGSVTLARFAVQVALQYEFDARERPRGSPTGYIPQGAKLPTEYPTVLYGTEIFELNTALREVAVNFARTARLNDSAGAQEYRALYRNSPGNIYFPATQPPSVVECDTATADNFWTGDLLGEAFENTTKLFTNQTGVYCSNQQEDNGTLEALLRANLTGLADFSRIILMRTASDFDRPHPGQSAAANLFQGFTGLGPSLVNIRLAGVQIILGILNGWSQIFEKGVKPGNYIGDIFGSLGGEPDFGPGSIFNAATSAYGPMLRMPMRARKGGL
jgi:purine nucleoside permease